ncbi:MAG: hypothetical protein KBS59_05125 [Clostridiales bacterium]|nr:hypothetical protein [Clostridiales bacterium]
MDIEISGSGTSNGGDCGKIRIAGSGKICGAAHCETFEAAGSVHAFEDILCDGTLSAAGSAHFDKNVTAQKIEAAGSFHADGNVTFSEIGKFSGAVHIGGDVKGGKTKACGALKVGGGIEADELVLEGAITCEGLVNAETIDIRFENTSKSGIGSAGGSKIEIKPRKDMLGKVFFFPRVTRVFDVAESIEGDDISLSYVSAPAVVGKRVKIGKGCKIGKVQYSESIDISEDAVVEATEII